MNCDFIDLKQKTINCDGVNLENLFFLLYLMRYLLFPTVLSGLPMGYLFLVARWRSQVSHV